MTDEEKLETIMGGGADAERVVWSLSDEEQQACRELADHLSCLACSSTLDDARANVGHALAWIAAAPRKLRGQLGDAREYLRDALAEAGGAT